MIAATVLALLALPLIVLRGRTLARYYSTDIFTWLLAWILWRRMPGIDPYFGFVAVAVLKLATFSVFLAVGEHVKWSANRAAFIAAIVYGLTIPAMLRTPIDGDEPYYLLVTESIVHDFDLDLRNQYETPGSSQTGRPDLTAPQFGDPVGKHGELYSRHELFLPILMIPGYLLGGLHGAIATIALFGVLLVRSTMRWMEDEGISDNAARAVFPLFAFGPPILFYAARIWPEVPGAFFFVEALRGVREHRAKRWLTAVFGLVMLKLRFGLVAIGIIARELRKTALLILAVPIVIVWLVSGSAMNVHRWNELIPTAPMLYVTGLGGLLVDGMAGIAFQAPFYLFALIALASWKKTAPGFRTGIVASLLYVFYLIPRGEWFGGWAPPLRYLAFLMPVLALGIASVWERIPRGMLAVVCAWTAGLVIHGLAYPWRLFHEFDGENALGEWLSRLYEADLSRFFPSFVRLNPAAWWGLAALALIFAMRYLRHLEIPLIALAIAAAIHCARQPGSIIQFEDAHVQHQGGMVYPDVYTMMRATYRGGWVLNAGDSLSFRARAGRHTLDYITGLGATFELAGCTYTVPASDRYGTAQITIPKSGRVTMRVLRGAINVDRMVHE